MFMFAAPSDRCREREPTYPISVAMPNGSCRWMSNENCWMYGERACGSTSENVDPIPVAGPSDCAAGCRMPLGNGFESEFAGVRLLSVDAMYVVVWL
jgi:hypothetical protein